MRSSLRGSQVVARKCFRRDEESIFTLYRNEARQKARSQLAVSMADDPHFSDGTIERAHHRVARGSRYTEMPLFEGANLAIGDW